MVESTLYDHWKGVQDYSWHWPNFTPAEIACRCCGELRLVPSAMHGLQNIRTITGVVMPVSSGYRCEKHNKTVNGGPAHLTGQAFDIRAFGERAMKLIDHARPYGFTRVGIKQHGPYKKRFVHLDTLEAAPGLRSPWIWSYEK